MDEGVQPMKKVFVWIIIIAVIAAGIGGFLRFREQQQAQQQNESILRTGAG